MLQNLTTSTRLESAYEEITSLLREHAEWLFVSDELVQSLRRDEIEFTIVRQKLMFSCWTEAGTRVWRLLGWAWNGQLLELKVSRKRGADVSLIQLIPRTTAKAVSATI